MNVMQTEPYGKVEVASENKREDEMIVLMQDDSYTEAEILELKKGYYNNDLIPEDMI